MNKTKKNKRLEKFGIVKNAALVFFLGVIILGGLQYYENRIVYSNVDSLRAYSQNQDIDEENVTEDEDLSKKIKELPKGYLNFVQPVLYNIGVIFIVLSVGTMLMELFGYVSFFQKRIAEVFTEQKMVNIINEEYKRELKTNLIESIYNPDTEDSKEILNLFDNKLSNIMDSFYYSNFDIFADCTLVDGKYIKKEITRTVVFKEINSNKHNSFTELLTLSYKPLDDGCKYKPIDMISINLNGKELIENQDYIRTVTESIHPYSKTESFKLVKEKEINNEATLKLRYDTIVPLKDRNYSTKINRFCKNMRIRVSFDNNDFGVFAKGFKFSTENNTDFVCEHFSSLAEANSNGWVLPGEGIAFSFFLKND